MARRGQAVGMRGGYLRGALPATATPAQMKALAAYVAAGGSVPGASRSVCTDYGRPEVLQLKDVLKPSTMWLKHLLPTRASRPENPQRRGPPRPLAISSSGVRNQSSMR